MTIRELVNELANRGYSLGSHAEVVVLVKGRVNPVTIKSVYTREGGEMKVVLNTTNERLVDER